MKFSAYLHHSILHIIKYAQYHLSTTLSSKPSTVILQLKHILFSQADVVTYKHGVKYIRLDIGDNSKEILTEFSLLLTS